MKRGAVGLPALPIVDPFCPLPAFTCGTEDILVPVRLSAEAYGHLRITAPNAKAAFGRRSLINGCFCVDRSKTDKGTTFVCEED